MTATSPARFWLRQVNDAPTVHQVIFDLFGGIALPLFCLAADPFVFRDSFLGAPLLADYRLLAYTAMALAMVSLGLWLAFGRWPALFCGLLVGGALFAALLGLRLLPFSLPGLVVLIGALGLAPFVTAFVFGRNAWRAGRQAFVQRRGPHLFVSLALGLLVSTLGPWGLQWTNWKRRAEAITLASSSDAVEMERGRELFKGLWFTDTDDIVRDYQIQRDPARRERLAQAYQNLTGNDIEARGDFLND